MTGAPKNLGEDTFPDPVDHLGVPSGHFGFCRRCCVAGGERKPPVPLGWYFVIVVVVVSDSGSVFISVVVTVVVVFVVDLIKPPVKFWSTSGQ